MDLLLLNYIQLLRLYKQHTFDTNVSAELSLNKNINLHFAVFENIQVVLTSFLELLTGEVGMKYKMQCFAQHLISRFCN